TITQSALHPTAGQQRPNLIGDNAGGFAPTHTAEGTAIRYLLSPSDARFPFSPAGPFFTGSGTTRRLLLPFEGPGTHGRNTTREPNEINVDAAVGRRFRLVKHTGVTIRAEAFNLFNRVNLNGPDTALTVIADPTTGQAIFNAPNFGLITSAKPA